MGRKVGAWERGHDDPSVVRGVNLVDRRVGRALRSRDGVHREAGDYTLTSPSLSYTSRVALEKFSV